MKKIYTGWLMLLIAAITMTSFTSCMSEDQDIADRLVGEWQGPLSEYYYDHYSWYVDETTYYTVFQFYGYSSYDYNSIPSGRGIERDYDAYDRLKNSAGFKWYVIDGVIHLDYDNGYQVQIYDYGLSSSRFTGRMSDNQGLDIRFDFDHTAYSKKTKSTFEE